MKLKYTGSIPVELRAVGGLSMNPSVTLEPITLVELVEKIDPRMVGQFTSDIWWSVVVKSGLYAGYSGYLPKNSLIGSLSALRDTQFGYGMVPNGDAVQWTEQCPHCGESKNLHTLPETTNGTKLPAATHLQVSPDVTITTGGTREDALRLISALESSITESRFKKDQSFRSTLQNKQIMIGVLHIHGGRKPWASHSNNQTSKTFQTISEELGFRYAPPVADYDEIWTRAFEKATSLNTGGVYGPANLHGFAYQCAAPRLIQAAVHAGEFPSAMSELNFHIKDPAGHGHTIPSCNRCRPRVPYMLCPKKANAFAHI